MAADLTAALAQFRASMVAARVYGQNDCAVAVNSVLVAAGWPDLLFGIVYHDRRSIVAAMRAMGCADLPGCLTAAALKSGAEALPGDFVPRDFDLGMIFCGLETDVGLAPAFFRAGLWHALSHTGSVHAFEAQHCFRHPMVKGD